MTRPETHRARHFRFVIRLPTRCMGQNHPNAYTLQPEPAIACRTTASACNPSGLIIIMLRESDV